MQLYFQCVMSKHPVIAQILMGCEYYSILSFAATFLSLLCSISCKYGSVHSLQDHMAGKKTTHTHIMCINLAPFGSAEENPFGGSRLEVHGGGLRKMWHMLC